MAKIPRTPAALTDLEGGVLAVIARDGPTTSYAVARAFAGSPSEFWSGSAGAIYPLMRRLAARKLIVGEGIAQGRRSATAYSLTPAGRAAFERWVFDAERAAGMGFDPLRTRLMFLSSFSAKDQNRFLDAVARNTEQLRDSNVFEDYPEAAELHQAWVKMRLAWIEKVRGLL